ncbi:MAG: hypothetical protein ACFBSE_14950 [Prochloraceae cyanobacterium]
MFLIALRLVIVLALAYLFGLLVAWIASLFSDRDLETENNSISTASSEMGSLEIDESYYLAEFDIYKNK